MKYIKILKVQQIFLCRFGLFHFTCGIWLFLFIKNIEIDNFNKYETFDKKKPITEWEKNNTLDC